MNSLSQADIDDMTPAEAELHRAYNECLQVRNRLRQARAEVVRLEREATRAVETLDRARANYVRMSPNAPIVLDLL